MAEFAAYLTPIAHLFELSEVELKDNPMGTVLVILVHDIEADTTHYVAWTILYLTVH